MIELDVPHPPVCRGNPAHRARFLRFSKAALDTTTNTLYTADSAVRQLVALKFHPKHGFSVRWRDKIESLEFVALAGPAAHRQLVFTDYYKGGDHAVWIDGATGRVMARSRVLADTPAPGNIVMPGFNGRFYYLGAKGQLWQLRPAHVPTSRRG